MKLINKFESLTKFVSLEHFAINSNKMILFPFKLRSKPSTTFLCFMSYIPSGYISVSEWCKAMETATDLGLPWRMLRDKLVALDSSSGKVKYSTTFDKINATDISVSTVKFELVSCVYLMQNHIIVLF